MDRHSQNASPLLRVATDNLHDAIHMRQDE
jgi:hypothetical protein